ncbi:MAG TPA: hypothetical protein VMT20_12950 [Terriglobia bacterium]|nr:hypothetical protein [Terriglobia bacterium]
MFVTSIGGLVFALLFWVLCIWALIWLMGAIRGAFRRFIINFENMRNSLDDSRRVLQAICDRLQSTEGVLEESSRRTNESLDASARALGAIQEALETMKPR